MGRYLAIVLDIVTPLFWMFEHVRLSASTAVAIAKADRIAVSSNSIREIGVRVNKGKLAIPPLCLNLHLDWSALTAWNCRPSTCTPG